MKKFSDYLEEATEPESMNEAFLGEILDSFISKIAHISDSKSLEKITNAILSNASMSNKIVETILGNSELTAKAFDAIEKKLHGGA